MIRSLPSNYKEKDIKYGDLFAMVFLFDEFTNKIIFMMQVGVVPKEIYLVKFFIFN